MLFSILHLNNKYVLNIIFLVKLKICKCRPHHGAARAPPTKKFGNRWPKALESNDIDIFHVLPSTKRKNPIIIKFVCRSIRNQIFASKSNLKADENNTEKLTITEALTKRCLRLVEEAKRVFGFENVGTFKGRVYCKFQGRRNA